MKIIILILISITFWTNILYANVLDDLNNECTKIHSVDELAIWLKNNMEYIHKDIDIKQDPSFTYLYKTGDCDDFARFNSYVLNYLKIENEIYIIVFNYDPFEYMNPYRNKKYDKTIVHAILLFKENGYYSFFTNLDLIRTKEVSIEKVIKKYYKNYSYYELNKE